MKSTRQEAIGVGDRRYFTGLPCPKGHIAARCVDNCSCVECQAERRAKNRDRHRAYTRVHYYANKENYIEKANEWGRMNPCKTKNAKRKWRSNNKEKQNAASRNWQKNNPERCLANVNRWRRENPERFRAIMVNRRARRAENGGSISGEEIKAIVARQKNKCAACGKRCKLEMDHIIPVARGGGGHAGNFQGLCRPCNRRKSDKHPIDFNRSIGLLL